MRQVPEFVMSNKTFVTLNSKFIKTWSMIHFQFIFFIHFKETMKLIAVQITMKSTTTVWVCLIHERNIHIVYMKPSEYI